MESKSRVEVEQRMLFIVRLKTSTSIVCIVFMRRKSILV